jgi:hypothetical protein
MYRVFDFLCPHCGELTERFVKSDVHEAPCEGIANRVMSAPQVKLEGITGSFPGAYHKWERVRNEKLQQERKKAEQR